MFAFKYYQLDLLQWGRLDKPHGLLLLTNRFVPHNLFELDLFYFCYFTKCTLYALFMESILINLIWFCDPVEPFFQLQRTREDYMTECLCVSHCVHFVKG